MSDVQSNLLENAILKFDEAEEEVDRLLDVINKANHQLKNARQLKRNAKKQLDEAIASARNELLRLSNSTRDTCYSEYSSGSEYDEDEGEEVEEASASSSSSGSEEVHEESDEQKIIVDIADEALEQIRYRLEVAKIDPSSQNGSSIVDELLSRLKNTKHTITDELVDEFMDDLLLNKGCNDEEEEISNDEDDSDYDRCEGGSHDNIHLKQSRIKICRGGKVLGWYQGGLDDRGYSREGEGTMYYNAGHICSGFWKDDEMVGRGVYQWADGHVYDGEWLNGKRHGLGRFIRPDGVVLFGRYEGGHHVGKGVRYSADRTEAQIVENGVPRSGTIDMSDAIKIRKELGFDP